jgi:hypothetical protein
MPDPLERDLAAYKNLLPTLTVSAGKFALFYKGEHQGVFDSYTDALDAGYKLAGLEPFLVKQILTTEYVAYFTRDIDVVCPI